MEHSMITTGLELPGYKITKNMGVARGVIVRSRSIIGDIGAGLQSIMGGNITILTELCEQSRSDAFEMLLDHAEKMGANAIIGMRYDANEVGQVGTEVLAYGTAVVVEKA
ncbi:MAG TPA: YbjQ family protein [Candidatus Paceibacterota bacterium]|nr:YbjQ family protein [Candidatus Paceibacterota bacterium]